MGLMPVEATMMVAILELDGATGSMVFGGRSDLFAGEKFDMQPEPERIDRLADRVARLVALRHTLSPNAKWRLCCSTSHRIAAQQALRRTSVFSSHSSIRSLRCAMRVTALISRRLMLASTPFLTGMPSNLGPRQTFTSACRWTTTSELNRGLPKSRRSGVSTWQGNGLTVSTFFVLGESFGNVMVGIQPPMGYEGDPMRMLFEGGLAPTHAFPFYRWLRNDFGANAVLHFGTHGSLEFMPGKQVGLSGQCWPDRLIADLPNVYLYAANNPSEGLIAKRRAASTLISYLTPPVTHADLYRHLVDLRGAIDHWRQRPADIEQDAEQVMIDTLMSLAVQCDLCEEHAEWPSEQWAQRVEDVRTQLDEIEQSLIPFGLHVVGEPLQTEDRHQMLLAMAESGGATELDADTFIGNIEAGDASALEALLSPSMGETEEGESASLAQTLIAAATTLGEDHELRAICERWVALHSTSEGR